MATTHAWFSAESALRFGSMVYRKPDGSTVNVTRMNLEKEGRRPRDSETYVGEVIRTEDGGCVQPKRRVDGMGDERPSPFGTGAEGKRGPQ
jgi:hypothetical protein